MNQEIPVRIILESPPAGVGFALQKGSGNPYETVQQQKSAGIDLCFECRIFVKQAPDSLPNFTGPFVQGPVKERFIYIDIGTYAGQPDSIWSRRLKIPLRDITPETIKRLSTDPSLVLETRVPGTGKDGGPNCATVKPFPGWHLVRNK